MGRRPQACVFVFHSHGIICPSTGMIVLKSVFSTLINHSSHNRIFQKSTFGFTHDSNSINSFEPYQAYILGYAPILLICYSHITIGLLLTPFLPALSFTGRTNSTKQQNTRLKSRSQPPQEYQRSRESPAGASGPFFTLGAWQVVHTSCTADSCVGHCRWVHSAVQIFILF